MRILMLSWEYPPHSVGGMSAQVYGLAHSLAAEGDEVVMITQRLGSDQPDAVTDQVRVLRADCDLPWVDSDAVAKAASANHHLVSIAACLGDWTPDIVHAHNWNVAWAAHCLSTMYRVPLVTTFHGTARSRHGGHVPPGAPVEIDNVEWWLALQSTRAIALTKTLHRSIVDDFELEPGRAIRIQSGINPSWWGRTDGDQGTVDGFVFAWGRVQYEKGFQVLARAIGALRGTVDPLSCSIAGRGSYLPELQSQIDLAQAGDLIDLPGFLNGDDLRNALHRAQCVVIPSLYEPFGVVALEALAAGAPLVAANTGGLAEVVGDSGAALLFEPGNADDLAASIERLLTDRDLAQQQARRGRELIESSYSWSAVAARTRSVYQAAIA